KHYGGDVYAHYAAIPIKALLLPDAKAEDFYHSYRYDGGKELPPDYQLKCVKACQYLNLCIRAIDEKGFIKEKLGIKLVDSFWKLIIKLIEAEDIYLPASYGRLVSKPDSAIKQYRKDSYASLISGHYGNKKAAKIGKTEDGYCLERERQQVAVIRKLARLHMNLDITQVTSTSNLLFDKMKWPQLSTATVYNLMMKYMPSLVAGRHGNKAYNNTVAMQVSRERPQYPTYYWTLDGWNVELLYQDGSKYDNRLVMVVVLDVMNNYPVGYAIGDRENTELIRMALRNAIIHMQDLFGATYRPWQLQSDRYGIKNLTPFYGAVAHLHTPAAVGNAKSKVVEPWFNYFNKKYCRLQYNSSGHNITAAAKNQPNTERLNEIKKQFPDKQGVIDYLNRCMHKERLQKHDQYIQAWHAMPEEDQVTLTPEDCLVVFGKAHNEFNSIRGLGLTATLEGKKYTFDSFDPEFRDLQFETRFQIIYDPEDFSQVVAVTEDGRRRFLLHNKMKAGMGFKNTTPQQLEYRQQIRDFNKKRIEEIVQLTAADDAIVKEIIDAAPLNLANDEEATLKLMFTDDYGQQKEHLQDAKKLKKATQAKAIADNNEWQQQQLQRFANEIDVNDFL
ncbi:MAG TPA: hypothetical protein PKC39_08235, partial [Ferruginibacter sp.]|nr:hypothetical protein [Ferruginibacter sp.]